MGNLETSLLARWRSILHEIRDKDGEQTNEDQRLTAVLGIALGNTRRLYARSACKATGIRLHEKKISHATWLELPSIKKWLHEEGLRALTTSDLNSEAVKVRVVQHSDDEEVEPEEANTQQEPSGGAANQSANETETSNDEIQREEIDLPKFDSGWAHVDQDKKPKKKGSNGAISKTTRKPAPAAKSAPNLNQSTPKTAHSYKTIFSTNSSTRP